MKDDVRGNSFYMEGSMCIECAAVMIIAVKSLLDRHMDLKG